MTLQAIRVKWDQREWLDSAGVHQASTTQVRSWDAPLERNDILYLFSDNFTTGSVMCSPKQIRAHTKLKKTSPIAEALIDEKGRKVGPGVTTSVKKAPARREN